MKTRAEEEVSYYWRREKGRGGGWKQNAWRAFHATCDRVSARCPVNFVLIGASGGAYFGMATDLLKSKCVVSAPVRLNNDIARTDRLWPAVRYSMGGPPLLVFLWPTLLIL